MASEYPLYVYDLTRLEHTMIVHSLDEEKDADVIHGLASPSGIDLKSVITLP